MKILFLHGLDSSRESTKFHAILHPEKFCIDVDYRNLSYASVKDFYHQAIETIKPDLLVGHSLGGYWALKTAAQHKLAVVVANPSLNPSFRNDYPDLCDEDLDHSNPKMAYLELGDEQLDMYQVQEKLSPYMTVETYDGGHHRLAYPSRLNDLITKIHKKYFA
ncbi:YqiA/YcfP family alpha/beta fold hydrolase [Acinetobacter baumannii]|uniref:YqiA/YcfP family alpha/beta fold hydrolase n=1 Tax=Acinetobacter baumannii TaxID=470 RepID=UPI00338E8FDD